MFTVLLHAILPGIECAHAWIRHANKCMRSAFLIQIFQSSNVPGIRKRIVSCRSKCLMSCHTSAVTRKYLCRMDWRYGLDHTAKPSSEETEHNGRGNGIWGALRRAWTSSTLSEEGRLTNTPMGTQMQQGVETRVTKTQLHRNNDQVEHLHLRNRGTTSGATVRGICG